jgi:hypothetical protein
MVRPFVPRVDNIHVIQNAFFGAFVNGLRKASLEV